MFDIRGKVRELRGIIGSLAHIRPKRGVIRGFIGGFAGIAGLGVFIVDPAGGTHIVERS